MSLAVVRLQPSHTVGEQHVAAAEEMEAKLMQNVSEENVVAINRSGGSAEQER